MDVDAERFGHRLVGSLLVTGAAGLTSAVGQQAQHLQAGPSISLCQNFSASPPTGNWLVPRCGVGLFVQSTFDASRASECGLATRNGCIMA